MSIYKLLDLIYNIFFGAILFPVIIGLILWKKMAKSDRWIMGMLVSLLILEIASVALQYNRVRNHFLYYFRTLSVFWYATFFFMNVIKWSNWPRIIAVIVSVAMILEIFILVGFNHINSFTLAFSRLILSSYAFICLKREFIQIDDKPLTNKPNFFHYIAFLVYGFFSAITLFLKNYFIETSLELYYFFDTLAAIVSAVAFCLFAIGFYRNVKLYSYRT